MKLTPVFLVLAALSGVASAALTSDMQTFSFKPTNTQTLNMAKFNSSLGTLTGITVTVYYAKSGGSVEGDNDAATVSSATFTSEVTGYISSSAVNLKDSGGAKILGATPDDFILTDSTTISLGATVGGIGDPDNAFNVTNGVDYYKYFGLAANATEGGDIGSSYWAAYQGSGTFAVVVHGTNTSGVSASGSVNYAVVAPQVDGSVTVAYTYTPVPEVSSLLLGGFGAIALLRRRR